MRGNVSFGRAENADDESNEPRVHIVVVNYMGWRDTLGCLKSLRALDYKNSEVVVVDNFSPDESVTRIRQTYPDVTLLRTPMNLGFAGGNNVGIRHAINAGSDWIWLLNNDTRVQPDTLRELVAVGEASVDVGVVGALLLDIAYPHAVQARGGGRLNMFLATTSVVDRAEPPRLDHIIGASMLIRREALQQIGLLDETYFFYLEDTDFSLRARRAGWILAVAERAVVYHKGGGTLAGHPSLRSLEADLHHARGTGVFIGKHGGRLALASASLRFVAVILVRLLRRQFLRTIPVAKEFWRGYRLGRTKRDLAV